MKGFNDTSTSWPSCTSCINLNIFVYDDYQHQQVIHGYSNNSLVGEGSPFHFKPQTRSIDFNVFSRFICLFFQITIDIGITIIVLYHLLI